ncbi:MAG: dnaK4 [Myxococcales bacterium]|nr:dnaK4 [Myxococcales bacterium]
MSAARFVVGVDLGTTNSAVAFIDSSSEAPKIEMFAIPQLVAPGMVEPRPTQPSFLYLPADAEFKKEQLELPWGQANAIVGELARNHGWQVPARLVSSAKSWLSHAGVDRLSPILPWQAPAEVPKVSPVEASARYLGHVRAAWDHAHPDAPLAEQDVLLTVPASFDSVARELTVRAAVDAGLPHVTLLEEPQAAFYSWLGNAGDGWRNELSVGDVVLVCDVGGGTTDFSLIAVSATNGNLELERVAVGDHILLGGDNMDLALGHTVRARLEAEGHKLDNWQFTSLVHSCRTAKEQLFSPGDRDSAPVVVLGRGSKVIGGSVRTELGRADVERVLVDGFFPETALGDKPKKARSVGLRELGLPFAADAAITRHLSAFVGAHRKATAVLFNGGVMKGRPLRQRIIQTLDSWADSPEDDLKVLGGTDLDLAVAHGAAYYGMVRRGKGVRIRGGTARAYYIGIESSMPAVPGLEPPMRALCVAPFGMEEGTEAEVVDQEFGLVVGEPAEFRFLASSTRRDDRVGTMVEDARREELNELSPVATALEADAAHAGQLIPVTLRSRVTEVGTLELWCVERQGDRRWKLEYNVREGVAQ